MNQKEGSLFRCPIPNMLTVFVGGQGQGLDVGEIFIDKRVV